MMLAKARQILVMPMFLLVYYYLDGQALVLQHNCVITDWLLGLGLDSV